MAEATPATTLTAWDDALKQYYIDKKPIDVAYNDHPFLTMIPKNTRFRGKEYAFADNLRSASSMGRIPSTEQVMKKGQVWDIQTDNQQTSIKRCKVN